MKAMKWLKGFGIGAVAACMGLSMAGCGDDDDDADGTVVVVTNVVDDATGDATNDVETIEAEVLYTGTQSVGGAADPLFRQTPDCEAPGIGTITATMTWDDGGEVHAWLNRSDDSEAESQDTSPIVLSHTTGIGQNWWVEIRNGTVDVQKNVTIAISYLPAD